MECIRRKTDHFRQRPELYRRNPGHAHTLGLERIDAQLLLLHTLGRADAGRAWLLAHDTDAIAPEALARFSALCQRRAAGEPVAYLTGVKAFYGLALHVDARVLDPRPDTETLVDWALETIAPLPAPRLLDLGTGSGAIALALQHQRQGAQVLAVDASQDALAVAQANATRLGLAVRFQHGHWLQGVEELFDVIVSNPPYIAAADPHLAALTHAGLLCPSGLDPVIYVGWLDPGQGHGLGQWHGLRVGHAHQLVERQFFHAQVVFGCNFLRNHQVVAGLGFA